MSVWFDIDFHFQEIQMLTIIVVEFVVLVLTLYVTSKALYFRVRFCIHGAFFCGRNT